MPFINYSFKERSSRKIIFYFSTFSKGAGIQIDFEENKILVISRDRRGYFKYIVDNTGDRMVYTDDERIDNRDFKEIVKKYNITLKK